MNIYMMTDLEGVAGVVSFEQQTYPEGRYHDEAKRLLTGEINAAVQGCRDAGAEDVLVIDGHGAGGIWFEDLHPDARLFHGRPMSSSRLFIDLARGFDAAMIIGQHAMAGVPHANLHHTLSSKSIDWIRINGEPVGEIALLALAWGAIDLPLVYLSGDDAACAEAEALVPGITTSR